MWTHLHSTTIGSRISPLARTLAWCWRTAGDLFSYYSFGVKCESREQWSTSKQPPYRWWYANCLNQYLRTRWNLENGKWMSLCYNNKKKIKEVRAFRDVSLGVNKQGVWSWMEESWPLKAPLRLLNNAVTTCTIHKAPATVMSLCCDKLVRVLHRLTVAKKWNA